MATSCRFFRARRRCVATGLGTLLMAMLTFASSELAATPPSAFSGPSASVGVAILQTAAWSPGDAVREGAGEFEVLLRVAQLQRAHAIGGVVSVGDHNGVRLCGGEQALTRAALTGIPVVKLARGGMVAPSTHGLFLDAGALSAERAAQVLQRCLEKHGAPPTAADTEHPTTKELAAIRRHLTPFQLALKSAAEGQFAAR